jgi:hypothetical protein
MFYEIESREMVRFLRELHARRARLAKVSKHLAVWSDTPPLNNLGYWLFGLTGALFICALFLCSILFHW